MITVALSATIGAPHERVWRALVDPNERPTWDERVLGIVALARTPRRRGRSAPSSAVAPEPIRRTRWRFRLGGVPLVLRDEILRADGHDRIVSRLTIGSMHFDQTLTLLAEDDDTGPKTRVGMKIVSTNQIAVLGEFVPRLDVQKLVIEYVDATLRQVQKYCEA